MDEDCALKKVEVIKDDYGNEIYCRYESGEEEWMLYDDRGNMIHLVSTLWGVEDPNNPKGILMSGVEVNEEDCSFHSCESWFEYDEDNNIIHEKHDRGAEEWSVYDKNHNMISCVNQDGIEEWMEYDDQHNMIHYKSEDTRNDEIVEAWYKYTSCGKQVEITEEEFDKRKK